MLFTEKDASGSIAVDTDLQIRGELQMMPFKERYVSGRIASKTFNGWNEGLQRADTSNKHM